MDERQQAFEVLQVVIGRLAREGLTGNGALVKQAPVDLEIGLLQVIGAEDNQIVEIHNFVSIEVAFIAAPAVPTAFRRRQGRTPQPHAEHEQRQPADQVESR